MKRTESHHEVTVGLLRANPAMIPAYQEESLTNIDLSEGIPCL